MLGRVAPQNLLLQEEAEKAPQRRQLARDRAAVEPLPVEPPQEIHHLLPPHTCQRELARHAEAGELLQVTPVSGYGVGRQAALHLNVVDERCNLATHYSCLGADGTAACTLGTPDRTRRPVTSV